MEETNQVVNALEPKIAQLNREVLQADAEARKFRAETDQFRGGPQSTTINAQRMASLNDELIRAEAARTRAEANWQTAQKLSTSAGAAALPGVQNSRVIQDLIAQRVSVERQLTEASAVLLPAHPRMRQLRANLGGLRRALRLEMATVIEGLEQEFTTAKLRVADIQRQVAQLKSKVVETSGNEAKLKSLENVANAKRIELERLQKQLEDNRTLAATRTVPVEAQIVSAARSSRQVVFPSKGKLSLLAMAATLILGLALVAAKEIMTTGRPAGPVAYNRRASDKIPSPAPQTAVAQRTRPTESRDSNSAPGKDLVAEPAPVTQRRFATISDIAGHLKSSVSDEGGFRTIVVGDRDRVNPGPEALELAGALGRSDGSVVVLDWSMDGNRVLPDLESDKQYGISDVLAGHAKIEDAIATKTTHGLHYIAPGAKPSNGRELLDADTLNLVLDGLDEAYEHVVVVGRHKDAQALFETVQGRFDAGLTIAEASEDVGDVVAGDNFLGFKVADIDIIRFQRIANAGSSKAAPKKVGDRCNLAQPQTVG